MRSVMLSVKIPDVVLKYRHIAEITTPRLESLSDLSSVMILHPGQSKYLDGSGHAFDSHRFE